jgi:serine phosphatase RsbU (regulator of sigma subunit)/putative methionine-R-sulfoxide reductase with GAF domain
MAKKNHSTSGADVKDTGRQGAKRRKPRVIAGTERQQKMQTALFEIADAASAATDMQSFYKRLHEIVGVLMYAENFFIALYDPQTDLITWPYYVDTVDVEHPEPIALKNQHGGTGWILRTGRTLSHAEGTVSYAIEHGEAEQTGTVSDAIGVPLRSDGKTVGVLFIQSYRNKFKYNLKHVKVMDFVAKHISIALTRARAIEETRQRNREIAEALEQQTATSEILSVIASSPTGGGAGFAYRVADNQIYLAAQYHQDPNAFQEVLAQFPMPLDTPENESNIASVIRNRAVLHIEDMKTDLRLTQWNRDIAAKYGAGTTLWMPLVKDEKGIGGIFIAKYAVESFTERQINLVKTFANQAVIAIENVRLFTETQRLLKETEDRAAELAIINSVQEGLASKLEMQAVYDLVGDKIREIFDAQAIQIISFDHEKNLMYRNYLIENGQRLYVDPLPISKVWAYFISNPQTTLLNNVKDFIGQVDPDFVAPPVGHTPRSLIAVPLMVNGELRGAIDIESLDRENAFSESDVRLLETLANSMSVALENARLFDETQRLLKETEDRAAELAVINSVQEGLASKLEMQAIYDLVGDKIMEIFEADVVGIGFYDPTLKALDHPYIVDHGERFFPPPMSVPDEMVEYLKTHDATLINTYQEAQALMERFGIHNIGGPTPDNSYIVVPLTISGEFMGRITVAKLPAYAFTESDVRLLQTLVNSMSVALENARLWEQEKLYRKALQRELEIGREIQAGFLPEALPQVAGWEIAASLLSAREVAGDFYDAFELPDGTIGLVIADVCDKGVGAALFMTLFRSLIRAGANLDYFEHTERLNEYHLPAERLQRAISLTNNYIAETHEKSGMFATLFFGILDPGNGTITYINGGHEPPLILRAGSLREALNKTGPAVGLVTNACFEILEVQLEPNDIFFAFTDGVPDCTNPQGEFYGRDRLVNAFRQVKHSAQGLVGLIAEDLNQYINGATRFDDITLLALHRGG